MAHIPGTILNQEGMAVVATGYGELGFDAISGAAVYACLSDPRYAGFVIGSKGHYITHIKQSSQAWVQIRDGQPEYGRPTQWFEIKGLPHQIMAAKTMIEKALNDAAARDESNVSYVTTPVSVPRVVTYADAYPNLVQAKDASSYGIPARPTDLELDEAAEALDKHLESNHMEVLHAGCVPLIEEALSCPLTPEEEAWGDVELDNRVAQELTDEEFEAMDEIRETDATIEEMCPNVPTPEEYAPNTRGEWVGPDRERLEYGNGMPRMTPSSYGNERAQMSWMRRGGAPHPMAYGYGMQPMAYGYGMQPMAYGYGMQPMTYGYDGRR